MTQNQNAAIIATSILIKRRNDEAAKKEADERQAAADAEKARQTAPMAQSRPQSINAIALRQNWLQSMTTPFLKKQAARQRVTARNKSMKFTARNRGKL